MNKNSPAPTSDREYYLFALKIVADFGALIAVPIVVLALIGQWLDHRYAKSPWFTVGGFALAALFSAKIIYKKAKKYGEEFKKMK